MVAAVTPIVSSEAGISLLPKNVLSAALSYLKKIVKMEKRDLCA